MADSGIKTVYNYLGNVPLIKIEKQQVNLNIPWIDRETLDKNIILWKNTLEQRKQEAKRAANEWSLGASCNATSGGASAEEIKDCKEQK